ncbi:MAG: SIMPL domain-containing protein [Caldilineaceae bacterium]|nr:SIMPL domain-containing protein [Caldilineaceae bacterium]
MDTIKTKITGSLLVAVLLLLGAFALPFAAWAPVANAQSANTATTPGTITVVGEGTVRIKPDIARVQIGVEVMMSSVKEASEANKATLEAVLTALQEQGIAEEDIQTSGFNVYAERFGPNGPLPDDQVNYRVSNNVAVTVRDLDTLGAVLDAAIEAGANNIYGVEFSLDDTSPIESEARASAVADALAKAEDLAELTGTTVGNVVSISEVIGNGGGYYSSNFAEAARGLGGGGSTPVSPGELELLMQLQVTYAIAQ